MSGTWVGEVWGGLMTEQWSPLDGGTMLAWNRMIKDGKTAHREFISIVIGDPTTLTVQVFHQPEEMVTYNLVRSEGREAVFENLDHERLQRMIYRRERDRVMILLEGRRKGEPFRDEIVLKLSN